MQQYHRDRHLAGPICHFTSRPGRRDTRYLRRSTRLFMLSGDLLPPISGRGRLSGPCCPRKRPLIGVRGPNSTPVQRADLRRQRDWCPQEGCRRICR